MKRILTIAMLTLALFALCFADSHEATGFVTDAKCAKAGKAGAGHAGCAKGCIGGGEPAVLVDADGNVLEIAEQDKVKGHAGAKVTIKGTIADGKISSIQSVEAAD